MPASRENYQITATEINGMLLRLNSILSRISDRLDKLEGLRGELETASGTFTGNIQTTSEMLVKDANNTSIHSMK